MNTNLSKQIALGLRKAAAYIEKNGFIADKARGHNGEVCILIAINDTSEFCSYLVENFFRKVILNDEQASIADYAMHLEKDQAIKDLLRAASIAENA